MRRILLATFCILTSAASLFSTPLSELSGQYLTVYFSRHPTLATAAGNHSYDSQLEDLSRKQIARWVEFNQTTQTRVREILSKDKVSEEDRLDAEALLGQVARELHALTNLRRAERDPLYWSSVIGDATVFLLVRDDLPIQERHKRARERAGQLPRFAVAAKENFEHVDLAEVAPEFCQIAAGQVRAAAEFYARGFAAAVRADVDAQGEWTKAAAALADLANFFDDLAKRAKGSPRLGGTYAETFRVGTGVEEPVSAVLARAKTDLASTRAEAAAFGRNVWTETMPGETAPNDDGALLRRLFDRLGADRDKDATEALQHWRENVKTIDKLVHDKKIMTLPDPLTLIVDLSPSFFVGQSVGGVYPPGPYAPDAKTILFIPAPPNDAPSDKREAFFRDFNQHFNKMIVAHELIPGHYVQFKDAARRAQVRFQLEPHRIRVVFPDPLYVEGWGTFCERLMNDQGWGGPLERLAHFKKQLENIARTIVDIRVHTENMTRDDVIKFVKEEALQNDQFASNMWTRALTSSPQICTYYLGYAKVRQAYEAARTAQKEKFELRQFMDGMMQMGPVSLDHYVERFRADDAGGGSTPLTNPIP